MWTIDPPRMIWRLDMYTLDMKYPFSREYIQDKNLKFFFAEPYWDDGVQIKFSSIWVSEKRFLKLFPDERSILSEEDPF